MTPPASCNDLRAGGETGAATIGVDPQPATAASSILMTADASDLSRGPDASTDDRRADLGSRQQPPGAHRRRRRTVELEARIAIVISNRASAAGLARAAGAGIETLVVDHRSVPVA